MILIQPIVYCTVALLSISASAPSAEDLADHVVFQQGDVLCGRIGADGVVETLSDNAHYETVDYPGGRMYVLLRHDDHHRWLSVLDCDSSGDLLRVRGVHDEKIDPVTAIDHAGFLPDGRLLMVLHVDPSTEVAVALDFPSNRRTIMTGNTFTPDATGRHIAYLVDAETDSPETIWMDGHKICDTQCQGTGTLAWNSTGSSFTATFAEDGKKDVKRIIRVEDGVAVAQIGE